MKDKYKCKSCGFSWNYRAITFQTCPSCGKAEIEERMEAEEHIL